MARENKMAELKTKKTDESVEAFVHSVENEKRRMDAFQVLDLMKEVTGEDPKMWGSSIVGFGDYHYKYKSGREGDWFLTGFSPRKQNLTLYIMSGFTEYDELMTNLGKFTTGKSCLYIKKIEDVDLPTLKKLVEKSADHMAETNR